MPLIRILDIHQHYTIFTSYAIRSSGLREKRWHITRSNDNQKLYAAVDTPDDLSTMKWKNIASGHWDSTMRLENLPLKCCGKALSVIEASTRLLVHIVASELLSNPIDYLGDLQDAYSTLKGMLSVSDIASFQHGFADLSVASYYMYIGSWAAAKEIFHRNLIGTIEVSTSNDVSVSLLSCVEAKILLGLHDDSHNKYDHMYSCGIRSSALMYSLGLVLNDLDSETALRILTAHNLSEASDDLIALTRILTYLSFGVRRDELYVNSDSCEGILTLFKSIKTVTGNIIYSVRACVFF